MRYSLFHNIHFRGFFIKQYLQPQSLKLSIVALLPPGLLCGFVLPVKDIPVYIRWISFLQPLTYMFRLGITEEFHSCGTPSDQDTTLLKCLSGFEDFFGTQEATYTNESLFTLTQTGTYQGEAAIAEYHNLGVTGNSQYAAFNDVCVVGEMEVMVNSFNDSHCDITFANVMTATYNFQEITRATALESVAGYRVLYGTFENAPTVIHEQHLYLSNPKYEVYFSELDPTGASQWICNILEDECGEEYFTPFNNQEECIAAMEQLPIVDYNANQDYVYTGNSTGCRFFHSLMVFQSKKHCAHISYLSQEDDSGNYKCDEKVKNDTPHNFTQADLDLFRRVAIRNEVNESSMGSAVDTRRPCKTVSTMETLEAFRDSGELESVDVICFGYLQNQEATVDLIPQYWLGLFGLGLGFRIIISMLLHFQSRRFE